MAFVGQYETYPDITGDRRAEGGQRLAGNLAASKSGAPLVTIITVCFNSARTIEQTIQSVRRQTYSNIEYIVVDGASTDGTVDILRSSEDLIAYFVSEPDTGLYHAMNKGIELARGAYVLVLNSDDWYEDDTVRLLVDAQLHSGADFTGGLARYVNEDGSSHILPSMPFDVATLLRMPLRHQTMLLSARIYDLVGPYDTQFPIIADFDLAIRLFRAGMTYFEVREPLLNFRTSGVSSTAWERLHQEHGNLVKKTFPFLDDDLARHLGDHSASRPADFIAAAAAHSDQPEFVLAVRAFLRDFKRLWGGVWAEPKFSLPSTEFNGLTYPKVSVVVPFYNASSHVEHALDTLLSQTLQEIEILFVDDCSSDDGIARLTGLAGDNPRVRILQNPQNLGPGGSRNCGIRAARGEYVMFFDIDDDMPADALSRMYEAARANESTIVRGAFRVERRIHGELASGIKHPAGIADRIVPATDLSETPAILETTEGHWAGLYLRDYVETILYPEDFRMGEDSVFLVKAVIFAQRITLIPDVVYIYRDSDNSAMNNYDLPKYLNEVKWRLIVWWVLKSSGFADRARYFLFDYWNPPFFDGLRSLPEDERDLFYTQLFEAFEAAGAPDAALCRTDALRNIFVTEFARLGRIAPPSPPLEVAMFTAMDSGGAGISAIRCMKLMRGAGLSSFGITMFKKSDHPDVFMAPLVGPMAEAQMHGDTAAAWQMWFDTIAVSAEGTPACSARELFSRPDGLVDFRNLTQSLSNIDVFHLHWVTGMIDYPNFPQLVGDRPVIWTLHDMNAFTGGCHYSEGCEGYRDACRDCPLLEPGATLAHEIWETKKAALDQIKTLHIVCPSNWLAECVRRSSLLGGREVHVIPNPVPVDHFVPTNKYVARMGLGLPLDRKYIAFGADSLSNVRKGGSYLQESLSKLKARGLAENVEGLFFGWANLDVDIPCHNMGYVSDPAELSRIYAAADVFAFPSLEDNAPQTIPESLLSGTPLVSFPVGNVEELVSHMETGYIARYADADSFTDGLAWALSDAGSRTALLRGITGHVRTRAYHEPQITINMYRDLYDLVIREAAGRRAGS